MKSSILKALEFQIDIDFDEELKAKNQKKTSLFENGKGSLN